MVPGPWECRDLLWAQPPHGVSAAELRWMGMLRAWAPASLGSCTHTLAPPVRQIHPQSSTQPMLQAAPQNKQGLREERAALTMGNSRKEGNDIPHRFAIILVFSFFRQLFWGTRQDTTLKWWGATKLPRPSCTALGSHRLRNNSSALTQAVPQRRRGDSHKQWQPVPVGLGR